MLRFKHFLKLNEELSAKEKAKVAKWPPRTEQATKATDPYFGKGVEDKYTQLSGSQDKSEIHHAIERHLGKQITSDEYKSGQTTDNHGRQAKIGKLLQKSNAPENLTNGFANDTTRQGKKFTGLTVRTTRSAEGIAGQTSGNQSWEQQSCKNFNTGSNKHYLQPEVQHGTVVHYLHDHKGNEIARSTAQPYTNKAGHTMYVTDSHYGIRNKEFMDHVEQANKELSGEHPKGSDLLYHKHPSVYNDNNIPVALHPSAKESDLDKALKVPHPEIKMAALRHHNITPDQLSKAQDDEDESVRKAVAQSPKANPKHLHKALDDENEDVRSAAALNKNADYNNLHKALDDKKHVQTRINAIQNGNIEESHLDKAITDTNNTVRQAVATHKKATPDHINKALDDHIWTVRKAALSNDKINPDHIRKAFGDKNDEVQTAALSHDKAPVDVLHKALHPDNDIQTRMAAAAHKNLPGKDISKILEKEDNFNIRKAAASNPSAEKHHIDAALNDKNPHVRVAAAGNKNSNYDHLHKALDVLEEPSVRKAAAENERAHSNHLHKALDDEEPAVRRAAVNNPAAKKEHIERALADKNMGVSNAAFERLAQNKKD
jgi:hypothetical protein